MGVLRVDGQDDTEKVVERVPEPRVGQLVTHPTAFGYRDDQATAAQAAEVVGQGLAGHAELVGEGGRIGRAVAECEQDTGASRVGQGRTEPGENLAV